jgi:hypothetical protein
MYNLQATWTLYSAKKKQTKIRAKGICSVWKKVGHAKVSTPGRTYISSSTVWNVPLIAWYLFFDLGNKVTRRDALHLTI